MIDFEPTDEQALIIETVRQFAENEIRPQCREADEGGAPSPAVLDAAHELGLMSISKRGRCSRENSSSALVTERG